MADTRVSRSDRPEDRHFQLIRLVRDAARNSPWIVIAVALHLVLIAGAAIFYTARHDAPQADDSIAFRFNERRVEEEIPLPPEPPPIRDSIPTMDDAELAPIPDELYVVDVPPEQDLTKEIGEIDGTDTPGSIGGTAIGLGTDGGPGLGVTPRTPRGPLGPGGPPRGDRDGRTKFTELAVLEGLRWLVRHQNDDGSWSPATLREHCDCDHPAYNPKKAYGREHDTGLTGLALLAFLGAGISHESRNDIVDTVEGKRYRAGEVVKKGLQWLVRAQNEDGSFTPTRAFLYNEALATMALSEAYGLTQHRFWREPAQRALDFLQAAQRPSPTGAGLWGWRYASRQEIERFHRGAGSLDPDLQKELFDADTSVTGWCVMALKSGQISGLRVADESLAGGVAFAGHVTQVGADGRPTGLAGYLDAKGAGAKVSGPNDQYAYHTGSMSALAMCIRIFGRRDPDDPFLRAAAEQIVKDLPAVSKDGLSVDYYYWYYASLALNQLDGPDAPKRSGRYWPAWNSAMVAAVLGLQDVQERACTRGGWLAPDRWSLDHGGPLYATALNVLTLEVYYRYANAFGGRKRN